MCNAIGARFALFVLVACFPVRLEAQGGATGRPSVFDAVVGEKNAKTPEISTEELKFLLESRAAVLLDTRPHLEWAISHIPGARNVPRSKVLPGKDVGEVKAAKDDGRLPMEDHNTRIVVFGVDAQQARAVAEALAQEAFHNVSYFEGGFGVLGTVIRR